MIATASYLDPFLREMPFHVVLLPNSYSSLKTYLKGPSSVRPPLSQAELVLLPPRAAALSTCTTALPTGGQWVGWVGDRLSSVVRIPIEVAGPRQPLNQVVQSPNQWGPTSTCRNDVCFPVSSLVSHMGQLRGRRPVLLLPPSLPRCLAHPPQLPPPPPPLPGRW